MPHLLAILVNYTVTVTITMHNNGTVGQVFAKITTYTGNFCMCLSII